MRRVKLVLICISFFVSAPSFAQTEPVADSTMEIVSAPQVDTAYNDDDDEEYENTNEEQSTDTLLSSNIIYFPGDSLKAISNTKPLNKIQSLDSLLRLWQEQQKSKKPAKELKPVSFGFFELVRLLLWAVMIGAVIYLIYRLFLSEKGLFTASVRKKTIVTEEEDITDTDTLAQRITDAEKAGNYRLAVRYYYLQALSVLAGKGWLQLSPDKTNYQYVRELSGKPIRNDFARITLHYEYAWYGNFTIDKEVYDTIKNEFKIYQTKLKS